MLWDKLPDGATMIAPLATAYSAEPAFGMVADRRHLDLRRHPQVTPVAAQTPDGDPDPSLGGRQAFLRPFPAALRLRHAVSAAAE